MNKFTLGAKGTTLYFDNYQTGRAAIIIIQNRKIGKFRKNMKYVR